MSVKGDLWSLGALEAVQLLKAGRLAVEDLAQSCLSRIEQLEPKVRAFSFLDRDLLLRQARAADLWRKEGRPLGPLFGLPVGIKDVIDTAGMPTEWGSPLYRGRRPKQDASIVRRLRQAGALIFAKTVTTEFAVYHPGPTRNPHDLARTPGGSSSGSAAAVAAGFLPLALGTQTNGSVIRPASFCGVFGFKPSFGLISRAGVLKLSGTLDHVGGFARKVEDLALLTAALAGGDPLDPATRDEAVPDFLQAFHQPSPIARQFALVKTPRWAEASPATQEAIAALQGELGAAVTEVELPRAFSEGWEALRRIMLPELAASLAGAYEKGRGAKEKLMSDRLAQMIEEGRKITATQYLAALELRLALQREMAALLEGFDAVLTPSAPGAAPKDLTQTGDPLFCSLWSLTGLPAISLPILSDEAGLPIGLQMVGSLGDDQRLLGHAQWLVDQIAQPQKSKKPSRRSKP